MKVAEKLFCIFPLCVLFYLFFNKFIIGCGLCNYNRNFVSFFIAENFNNSGFISVIVEEKWVSL